MRKFAALAAVGLVAASAGPAPAKGDSSVYSAAAPPTPDQLRPLNLTTVWTTAVPIEGRRDAIESIQVVDTAQIFVQTRAGVLVALDAATGAQQWVARYDTPYSPIVPVAVNDRFVFATNVIRLYCFRRYTGVLEFAYNLPLAPHAAPAADEDRVYVTVGSGRVMALDLPPSIHMPDPALTRRPDYPGAPDPRAVNPAQVVATRYPTSGRRTFFPDERFEESRVNVASAPGAGLATLQRTPSLAVLPTVLPPYHTFDDRGRYLSRVESLTAVSTLRQPYHLQNPLAGITQRTPSIAVIPPSVARVYELTNLLPRGVEPGIRWVYGSTVRMVHTPLLTRQRIWMTTAVPVLLSVLKDDKTPQVDAPIPDDVAAPGAQAEDIGYFPLRDGNLLAVPLDAGGGTALKLAWRANVGGLMDRQPIPTAEGVFTSGVGTGVARVDRRTGELVWRTDPNHDTLLAVNREHAYVWDRTGQVHVYDRLRATDPVTRRTDPLVSVPLPGFSVPVTNAKTDRVLLAADNGLIVCLRDAAPGYARPIVTGAPLHAVDQLPKKPLDAVPPATTDPMANPPPGEKTAPEKKL